MIDALKKILESNGFNHEPTDYCDDRLWRKRDNDIEYSFYLVDNQFTLTAKFDNVSGGQYIMDGDIRSTNKKILDMVLKNLNDLL